MPIRRLFPALLIVSAALVGCTSKSFESRLNVESSFNPDAPYESYKTFDWAPYSGQETGLGVLDDQQVRTDLRRMIEEELTSRGLKWVTIAPDLLVGYHAAVEAKIDEAVIEGYYDEQNMEAFGDFASRGAGYEEGSLVLMIFDARTGKMLWRATAQAEVDQKATKRQQKERLKIAVRKMLETMPRKGD